LTPVHICDTVLTYKQRNGLEKFYSVKEFADILGVHANTVRKMIVDKRLHPINVGSAKMPTYRIPDDDILRLRAETFEQSQGGEL